ncbi:MAG: hypothetical protein WEG36_10785 [Gemmatimonadota bacterium]
MSGGLKAMATAALLAGGTLNGDPIFAQQQTSPGGTPLDVPADTIELVYDREVFSYPGYDRRNPFRPLTGAASVGPRFEDLVLMGRIISSNPASSIALVGARQPGTQQGGAPERTYRLRVGDILGDIRLLEIRDQMVLLEVVEFGLRETRMLELRRNFSTPDPAIAAVQDAQDRPAPEQAPAGGSVENAAPDGAHAHTALNGNGGWS